ncbi:MAG TPA: NAD(P)-dependent oxidoreductase [Aquella sp.]|nr:NAD(P)-dependent oxidoreductase [Aquella sp.]
MSLKNFISQSLLGKRLFITGGTGFIGKNILNYLHVNQVKLEKISVLTRNSQKFVNEYPDLVCNLNIECIEKDILSLNYDGADYDYVIHASTSATEKTPSILLMDETVIGAKNILDYARKCKAKSVINLSSGAVYGDIDTYVKVTEDFIYMPKISRQSSSYGIGKLVSEHYSYLYATDKMKVTSLRCFCIGGEYLDLEYYVLGNFIKQATKNETITVQAGKGIYRSYLAAEDLVEATLYTMIKANERESDYEVYNIGSDEAIAISDLARAVCRVLNSKSQVTCPNLDDEKIFYYVPCVDKIRKTGLKMSSKLEDIILDVQKYYLSQMSL